MKKRHICAVFSLYASCFVIFALRNRCVSSANEYWFWAMICRWLFHCWWIFLRRWMFFLRGIRKGRGVDGLVWLDEGMVGDWPKMFARACMRAPVLRVLFFCCHKCHSGWGWKYFIIPKTTCCFMESDVSFYGKQRVVLWKVTGCFMENNVSFCGKQRVVLDWRSKSCFEDGVLGIFWGGVVAWKCDSEGCCF